MKYFVYILQSAISGKLYIGQTRDLGSRLEKNNNGYNKSTKNDRPWEVIFSIEFGTRAQAMALERKLKALKKRDSVFRYVRQNNGM